MPWYDNGYSPWDEETGECEQCGGEGVVDCVLCDRDDPDRGNPCIDCGNTYEIQCDGCSGFGHESAAYAYANG